MSKRRRNEQDMRKDENDGEDTGDDLGEEGGHRRLRDLIQEAGGTERDWCARAIDEDYDPAVLATYAERLWRISEECPLLTKGDLERAWKDAIVAYMNRV